MVFHNESNDGRFEIITRIEGWDVFSSYAIIICVIDQALAISRAYAPLECLVISDCARRGSRTNLNESTKNHDNSAMKLCKPWWGNPAFSIQPIGHTHSRTANSRTRRHGSVVPRRSPRPLQSQCERSPSRRSAD